MAEPARKLPAEDRPDIPGLSAIQGGGEGDGVPSGDLQSAEESGVPEPDEGRAADQPELHAIQGSGKGDGVPRGKLRDSKEKPEEEGGLASGFDEKRNQGRRRSRLRLTRRKKLIGAGVGGGTVATIFTLFSILSGPSQLVHLSSILQRSFAPMRQSTSVRMSRLFLGATSNYNGDTRVGVLGSLILRPAFKDLHNIGVDFQLNSSGYVNSVTIDTTKLAEQRPELRGMSLGEQKAWLADELQLSPDQFVKISGVNGHINGFKLAVNTRDFGLKEVRLLKNNFLGFLDDGTIITAINERYMSKFFGIYNLFHPFKKLTNDQLNKWTTAAERKVAEADRVNTEITEPVDRSTAGLRAILKDKLDSIRDPLSKALITTAVVCAVRGAADSAVAFNHAAIVAPAALEATDLIAVGEQAKAGQDISMQQAGGVAEGFQDSNGRTIWQGKALQALSGQKPTGPDLPSDYGQAFSDQTTADNIRSGVDLGGVAGALCSTPGIIAQAVANLALFIANIPDGETGSFATYAAGEAAGTVAVGGVTYFFEHQLASMIADKAIVPSVLSGPLGGNLAAYGARAAANIGAIASGGVRLAGSTVSQINQQQEQQSEQQFRSESFFARMFDVYDYRSLAGRLADSISPNPLTNVSSIMGAFSNMGSSLLSNLASIFVPRAHADYSYDWGFPQYGIPSDLLNDPSLSDPYGNADTVAALFDSGAGQGYIERAQSCFGVSINKDSGVWDVLPQHDVDTNGSDYLGAHCDDLSDPNWKRVVMFVFDTSIMKSAACYEGDDQSCSDIGIGNQSSSGSTVSGGNGTLPTGTSKDLASQLLPLIQQGKITCGSAAGGSGPANCLDIQNTANGTPIGGNCAVNSLTPHLLGLILGLVRDDGWTLGISAICSNHSPEGDGAYAGHSYGSVADFSIENGATGSDSAANEKFVNDAATLLTQTGGSFGQINCHPTYPALSRGNFTTFSDTCNHQHIRAAP